MKIKIATFCLIICTLSACISKKPVIRSIKYNEDGTIIVNPEWNARKTYLGKVSPYVIGLPIGLISAGLIFELTGEFPGMEFVTLGSVIAGPILVHKFNNKLLKRAKKNSLIINKPDKWLRKYNKKIKPNLNMLINKTTINYF